MKESAVTANCLHPGVIKTKLLRAGFGDYPGSPPENGARTPIYLASSPDVKRINGKYFVECRPAKSSPLSYNKELQKRFWVLAETITGTA